MIFSKFSLLCLRLQACLQGLVVRMKLEESQATNINMIFNNCSTELLQDKGVIISLFVNDIWSRICPYTFFSFDLIQLRFYSQGLPLISPIHLNNVSTII